MDVGRSGFLWTRVNIYGSQARSLCFHILLSHRPSFLSSFVLPFSFIDLDRINNVSRTFYLYRSHLYSILFFIKMLPLIRFCLVVPRDMKKEGNVMVPAQSLSQDIRSIFFFNLFNYAQPEWPLPGKVGSTMFTDK